MKNLLKWALPAFFAGIVPVMGSQELVGEINDSFFTSPGTALSVRMAIESGDKVMLMVDATNETKSESKKAVADCADDGWEMNDADLTAQQKVIAQVICGTQVLEKSYTKRKKIPYGILKPTEEINLLDNKVLTDLELPLGQAIEICTQAIYKRPDGTELAQRGSPTSKAIALALLNGKALKPDELFQALPLNTRVKVVKAIHEPNASLDEAMLATAPAIYDLLLEEKTVPQGAFHRCYEHKNETSTRGIKVIKQLRHWQEHYSASKVTREIYKLKDGQKIPYLTGPTETLLRLNSRDSGRTNQPECAPLGSAFPPNSRIVQ